MSEASWIAIAVAVFFPIIFAAARRRRKQDHDAHN